MKSEATTTWNAQGLARPVEGLLYLYLLPYWRNITVFQMALFFIHYFGTDSRRLQSIM